MPQTDQPRRTLADLANDFAKLRAQHDKLAAARAQPWAAMAEFNRILDEVLVKWR